MLITVCVDCQSMLQASSLAELRTKLGENWSKEERSQIVAVFTQEALNAVSRKYGVREITCIADKVKREKLGIEIDLAAGNADYWLLGSVRADGIWYDVVRYSDERRTRRFSASAVGI